jgi:Radical SAM superfamily/4Fe-4S single cluster domain
MTNGLIYGHDQTEDTMKITGLHLLMTYQCTFECDHCFVWGSPQQSGVMTLQDIRRILTQAQELGTVEGIYFEGGEPFLYYAVLVQAVREAAQMGFSVGVVSNAYWATCLEDAIEWLKPMASLIQDLSVSSDLFHYDKAISQQSRNAAAAAQLLGVPLGTISIAQPQSPEHTDAIGQIPTGDEATLMYRGRAAVNLASKAQPRPWETLVKCPYEDLRDPGRLHVDPLGYLHICQGIAIGNLFEEPLEQIVARYDPDDHPICGALLAGGPVELVRRYNLPHRAEYADACHLCYESRIALRNRFPNILTPDQMYG